jgi:translation initiation factor IF-3
MSKKEHKLNNEIVAREVRIEGDILKLSEALKRANDEGLDLVLINDKGVPPVCRIMNYEKFIYEQKKAEKAKVKPLELKEIKLGPNTSENDIEYRVKHIVDFLKKGHKVKISLQFRGRQMNHIDIGQAQILKMIVAVEDYGVAESMPKLVGKKMFATLKPIKK